MTKRRLNISLGIFLLMLMSIGLTISTLHSHHNLEFHNSAGFAETGHCLSVDTTLCPICGYVLQASEAPSIDSSTYLKPNAVVPSGYLSNRSKRVYVPLLGRSPPSIA